MSKVGLAAKQKSYIIMDAGGTYLKSAVLDEDGTAGNWTNIVESIKYIHSEETNKNMHAYG